VNPPVPPAATDHAPKRTRFSAYRSNLVVLVGFNGVAQLAPIVVLFALTPLLLHRLGLDRFGIWSLALVALNTLTVLDGGISASLARFFAAHAAHHERADTGRLLFGALVVFFVAGLVLTAVAFPLAPAIVDLLDIPPELRHEAGAVLRWVPLLAGLALMADSSAALLQGNSRFRALAGAMVVSSATWALAIIVLVQPGAHLGTLILATALRYVVLLLASLAFAARDVTLRRPLLPSREARRELRSYASRMQVSAVTAFVNGELDALVIAAVLPVRYVGLYGIGMQAASAVRSLPLYVFAPILTRLTTTFGTEGRPAAAAEFARFERKWLPGVLGYGVVAVAATGFGVPIWLGDAYTLSGEAAAILLAGYMVHVGFTGMRTCYVRAIGRPGLETRYQLVWAASNALLTLPLALLLGMLGVVATTAGTGVVASLYFVGLCRRAEGLPVLLPPPRWWEFAAMACVITVAGELVIMDASVHGYFALALAALPALVGLLVCARGLGGSAVRLTA
jgi:O-antigen/teichoic acid export membrane protein